MYNKEEPLVKGSRFLGIIEIFLSSYSINSISINIRLTCVNNCLHSRLGFLVARY